MPADHPVLNSYRKAIEAMQKRDLKDPLSWRFQANLHGSLEDGINAGWDWCMHGNWWFLPWHRGYLYYFERIVRRLSGDDTFRLPYWPWEKDGQNVLPRAFRDQKYQGRANPLFDSTRVKATNEGRPLLGTFSEDWKAVIRTAKFTTGFADLSFGGVQAAKTVMPGKPMPHSHGVMESRAHDLIHDAVGDDTGNMGDPRTAARDPIFWLHHANVDRLWNRWLDNRGHSLPDPKIDKDWYEQEFPFYDENGKQVVVAVGKILVLAGSEDRYDEERRVFAAAPPVQEKAMKAKIVSIGAIQPMLALGAKPLTKTLELTQDAKPMLMTALANSPKEAEPAVVLLRVEGIEPPKDAKVAFEVFVTKKGEEQSGKAYVGPIAFFGRRSGGGHVHGEGGNFTQGFDVTELVQNLSKANKGQLPELEVSVVPHSTAGLSDEDLAKQNIKIPISNITLKLVAVDNQ